MSVFSFSCAFLLCVWGFFFSGDGGGEGGGDGGGDGGVLFVGDFVSCLKEV